MCYTSILVKHWNTLNLTDSVSSVLRREYSGKLEGGTRSVCFSCLHCSLWAGLCRQGMAVGSWFCHSGGGIRKGDALFSSQTHFTSPSCPVSAPSSSYSYWSFDGAEVPPQLHTVSPCEVFLCGSSRVCLLASPGYPFILYEVTTNLLKEIALLVCLISLTQSHLW